LLGAGTDACELIHYGMELVNVGRSVFDVISTLFTAVTVRKRAVGAIYILK
jgi:hypothetical protein